MVHIKTAKKTVPTCTVETQIISRDQNIRYYFLALESKHLTTKHQNNFATAQNTLATAFQLAKYKT